MKHTIYIRKEDEIKWKAIINKPKWLHDNLTKVNKNNKIKPKINFRKKSMMRKNNGNINATS